MANTPLLGSFSDVGGSSLMFRNAVINSDMTIHQRQTVAATSAAYSKETKTMPKSQLINSLSGRGN